MTTQAVSASKTRRGHPQTNPNSLANLIPYKKGQNGNPKPGNSLKAVLMNALGQPLKKPAEDAPVRDHIVYATLKGAIDLTPVAFREAWDRAEGKVADSTLPVSQDNRVVNFVFILPDGTKLAPKALVKGENDD